jgi:mannose-6-phosphate isomerase-like protein (cupin superfamily)
VIFHETDYKLKPHIPSGMYVYETPLALARAVAELVSRYAASYGRIAFRIWRGSMNISADAYMNEPVQYPALQVINLKDEGAKVADPYRNMVINRVNGSCLRLAVFDGEYRWHHHPTSDELFIVVEGCLAIDLEGGRKLQLHPWESVTIPAKTVHRTRALGRTVNLCFEELGAETVFVEHAA